MGETAGVVQVIVDGMGGKSFEIEKRETYTATVLF